MESDLNNTNTNTNNNCHLDIIFGASWEGLEVEENEAPLHSLLLTTWRVFRAGQQTQAPELWNP